MGNTVNKFYHKKIIQFLALNGRRLNIVLDDKKISSRVSLTIPRDPNTFNDVA